MVSTGEAGAGGAGLERLAPPALALVLLGVIIATIALHIAVGAKPLPLETVFEAFVSRDATEFDHMIVWDLRLPRAILAVIVGASLAVAGALMQGVTRNPLADPGILGLMAGASFAVVMSANLFGNASPAFLPWIAACGALAAAAIVYTIALWAPGGPTPATLTLSGAAVAAFLGAWISLAHILNEDSFDQLRVWLTGSLAGRDLDLLVYTGPPLLLAMAGALALARQVTVLSMGEEVAIGLGVRTGRLKVMLLLVVVMLTACSVALAGPLGFIGLVIPHVVRLFAGSDYRLIVPFSALAGAAYLTAVDIVARIALQPQEISTGLVTAILGAPLFVFLVWQKTR
jgi:iron complex transport system permease protein